MPSRNQGSDRRSFLKTAGATAAVSTGLAGCLTDLAGQEPSDLTIAVWGGFFEETLREHVAEPFQEETDIETEVVPQESSPVAVSTYINNVNQDEAPVDVAALNMNAVRRGLTEDIWHIWDDDELDHLSVIEQEFIQEAGGGIATVGAFAWYNLLIYNNEEIDEEITSWEVLWDSEFEDMVGAFELPESNYLLDIAAELYFDGRESLQSRDQIEEVLEKVAEIEPQMGLWYQDEATFQESVSGGDVPIGQMYSDVGQIMESGDPPVDVVFPEEGSVLEFGSWCTLEPSERTSEAREFINYATDPENQVTISQQLGNIPVIEEESIDLPAETYDQVTGHGIENAIEPAYDIYNEDVEWLRERWNEFVTDN